MYQCRKEELPRLPPVKLKSKEKPLNTSWEEKFEHEGPASKIAVVDSAFLIRLYLDVPLDKKSTLQVENELPRTVGNLQVKALQRKLI